MTKTTLKAREIVEDVRRGLADSELMEKFGLSPSQLQRVFASLVQAGSLKQFELDQRSGSTVWKCPTCGGILTKEDGQCNACGKSTFIIVESEMAERRDPLEEIEITVTSTGNAHLKPPSTSGVTRGQVTFKPLPKVGKMLERVELDLSENALAEPASPEELQELNRGYFIFSVPVYDTTDLDTEGSMDGFQRNALQVSGIPVDVGETRSFLVRADDYADVYPFVFEAVCRWVKQGEDGQFHGGFEVTNITKAGFEQLRKMFGQLAI